MGCHTAKMTRVQSKPPKIAILDLLATKKEPIAGIEPAHLPFSAIGKVRDTTSPNGPAPADVLQGLRDL